MVVEHAQEHVLMNHSICMNFYTNSPWSDIKSGLFRSHQNDYRVNEFIFRPGLENTQIAGTSI